MMLYPSILPERNCPLNLDLGCSLTTSPKHAFAQEMGFQREEKDVSY